MGRLARFLSEDGFFADIVHGRWRDGETSAAHNWADTLHRLDVVSYLGTPGGSMHRHLDHMPRTGTEAAQNGVPMRVLRRLALYRLVQLGLNTPFTWQAYLGALQRENVAGRRRRRIEIVRIPLPPGTFGQWIVHCQSTAGQIGGDQEQCDAEFVTQIVESLLVPLNVDDDHLERIVYHELGHRELGHVQFMTEPGGRWAGGMVCDAAGRDDLRERDAELFATLLSRLAHGWDPGALHAPRLDSFFDLLS